ncbi:inner centromere protein isoform X2 [Linepithema humile]|uniref:inner centromere protein isoform X2 n=1 Tax=Linepithema humile TaxID=83485 RepID=UPI00351F04C7
MMVNDSDVDSWKTESECNGFGQGDGPNWQRKIALIDHHVHSNGTYGDATLTRTKISKCGSEIRYINPAIYTESVDEEKRNAATRRPENDQHCDEQTIDANRDDFNSSTIDLPSIAKNATSDDHAEHPVGTGQNTYRCYSTSFPDTTLSLEPLTARSAASSGTITRIERRCKISSILANVGEDEATKQDKCTSDNRQIVRISATSLAIDSSSASDCQMTDMPNLGRRIAHSEWIRRKHEAARRKKEEEERAAKKRQEEEKRVAREKEERARLEKENFLKWVETKKRQELDRKAMLENELELQKRLKEIEDKAAVAKALYLRQWAHKKKEEQKARHKEQETRQRKINEERERRLEQSSKAYEKWRENSKNKPKPATQGLLPHQKAKPAYVNPIPWQSIVDPDSDEARDNAFSEKKENINQLKTNRQKNDGASVIKS